MNSKPRLKERTMNPVVRNIFWSGRFSALVALAVVGLLFTGAGARAGCGDPRKGGQSLSLSWMNHSNGGNDRDGDGDFFPTIVGLWHLKYTADDGSPFLESFKTWHADGTEFENAFLPPAGGNICFGVWKEVGHRTVKLHHVGINFDAEGKISGSFTIDETDTVATDGKTYKGTFDFKAFDPSGNMAVEVKGTTAGTRISVS
jgi:hypothetical protein